MEIREVSFSYRNSVPILENISLKVESGAITTLLGANGSGKTTLLKLMTKNLVPSSGKILLAGQDIADFGLRDFAKRVAIVHQKNSAPADLTVRKLVAYGRIPYTSVFHNHSQETIDKVQWAMEITDLLGLADRRIGTLSGGQRQRAFLAMALAQDSKILLLDEPTTFLDVRYQIEILRLIRKLNQEFGMTIVMVLHDINQALVYSDQIIGLKQGQVVVQGSPEEKITSPVIKQLYDIDLEVTKVGGKPCVLNW